MISNTYAYFFGEILCFSMFVPISLGVPEFVTDFQTDMGQYASSV